MKRRRLIVLGGSVIAGLSGLVSSGAFSTVSAERIVEVGVADDAEAYLGLEDTSTNGRSSSFGTPHDQIRFSIPSAFETTEGEGINQKSSYTFDDLLRVTNQGNNPVVVWGEYDYSSSLIDDIALVGNGRLLDEKENGITLTPGNQFSGGLFIKSTSGTGSELVEVDIHAESSDVSEDDIY